MEDIKCKCGNKGCTTTINIEENTTSIDVVIGHSSARIEIALDANDIVALIKQLKQALVNLAS